MIIKHAALGARAATIALVVVLSLAAFAHFFPDSFFNERNRILIQLITFAGGLAYLTSFWQFSKAKGYSGYFGLLLTLFSLLGIVILILKKDKCKDQPYDFVKLDR